MAVILETSLGDITIDLYTEERPRCCLNFLKLCKIKYYNFCLFHSVQKNLVAQSGDPTGTGRGGQSVFAKLYGEQAAYFDMEIKPRIKHKSAGLISMVNNGSNMHGSQFFITTGDNLDYLDGDHTVFAEVAEGLEVLQKINEAYSDSQNRPYKDIRIYHTVVLDDPYDDPAGLETYIPDRSPEPTKEQLQSSRIGADEEIDDNKGKTSAEINEMVKERESKTNAQLLEMVGDLPTAEVEAPDTVLFVCKLNPVTTSEDLEIIFSRFGNILSCEVIKDHKTEESLQYAFIEFEKPSECENAYFKMDNVLIDDRRIHVDFSQSVSKIKWKGKGKGVEHVQEEKIERQQYMIKDRSKKDNYDLVYDEEDDEPSTRKDRHHEHKKKKKHKSRSRSRSPKHKSKKKARSRSRSRSRERSRDYSKRDRHEEYSDSHYRRKDSSHYDRERKRESASDNRGRHNHDSRKHDRDSHRNRYSDSR